MFPMRTAAESAQVVVPVAVKSMVIVLLLTALVSKFIDPA
jgi:hypothetical protein